MTHVLIALSVSARSGRRRFSFSSPVYGGSGARSASMGAFVSCARPALRARKERERRSSKFPVIPCYEGNIERGPNKLGRSERSFFTGRTGGLTGKRTGRLLPVMMEERRGFPGNFEWKTGTKNFHTKRSNESWSALGRFVLVLYRGYLSVRK